MHFPACSPRVCVGSLQELQLPPTHQCKPFNWCLQGSKWAGLFVRPSTNSHVQSLLASVWNWQLISVDLCQRRLYSAPGPVFPLLTIGPLIYCYPSVRVSSSQSDFRESVLYTANHDHIHQASSWFHNCRRKEFGWRHLITCSSEHRHRSH